MRGAPKMTFRWGASIITGGPGNLFFPPVRKTRGEITFKNIYIHRRGKTRKNILFSRSAPRDIPDRGISSTCDSVLQRSIPPPRVFRFLLGHIITACVYSSSTSIRVKRANETWVLLLRRRQTNYLSSKCKIFSLYSLRGAPDDLPPSSSSYHLCVCCPTHGDELYNYG